MEVKAWVCAALILPNKGEGVGLRCAAPFHLAARLELCGAHIFEVVGYAGLTSHGTGRAAGAFGVLLISDL